MEGGSLEPARNVVEGQAECAPEILRPKGAAPNRKKHIPTPYLKKEKDR
jgi:hypothetical protein